MFKKKEKENELKQKVLSKGTLSMCNNIQIQHGLNVENIRGVSIAKTKSPVTEYRLDDKHVHIFFGEEPTNIVHAVIFYVED